MKKTLVILKFIGIAFIITFFLLVIASLIMMYTEVNEEYSNYIVILITAISLFFSSLFANNKIKRNGIINGVFIGGGYVVFMYLISSVAIWQFNLTINSLIMICVGILSSIAGGIIGVNRRKKSKDVV